MEWQQDVVNHNSAALCAVVIALSRHVKQLIFVSYDTELVHILHYGLRSLPFADLQNVHITTHKASRQADLRLLPAMSYLLERRLTHRPTLMVSYMGGSCDEDEDPLQDTTDSEQWCTTPRVEKVGICNSDITPEDFAWIVRGMKDCERFCLEINPHKEKLPELLFTRADEFARRFLASAGSIISERRLFLAITTNGRHRYCVQVLQMQYISELQSLQVYFPDNTYATSWSNMTPKDRTCREKYRRVSISEERDTRLKSYGIFHCLHPLLFIILIFMRPRTAEYVEELCWNPDQHLDEPQRPTEPHRIWPELQSPRFYKFYGSICSRVAELVQLQPQDFDEATWTAKIAQGDPAAWFAVLLTMLPNLQHLRCDNGLQWCKPLLKPIFKLACQHPSRVLSHLESFSLRNRFGSVDPFEALDEVVYIPSLRKLDVNDFGALDHAILPCNDALVSNLECVEIVECRIPVQAFKPWLASMINLKRLDMTYSTSGSSMYRSDKTLYLPTFPEEFKEECGAILTTRKLRWKFGSFAENYMRMFGGDAWQFRDQYGLMIRCAELAHEMDQMYGSIEA